MDDLLSEFRVEVKKNDESEPYIVNFFGLQESLTLAIAYSTTANHVLLVSNKTAEVLYTYEDKRESGGGWEIYITPNLCLAD